MADIGTMQEQLQALEAQLGSSVSMVATFDGELSRMRETMIFTGREVNTLSGGIGGGLRKAFDGLVFDGMKLNDALKSVANTIVDTVYNIAMKPVTNALGGFLAQGVAGLMGGGMPFAKGGIVGAPTTFPMRGGMGLMGEAGPEAIMPLARGPDGRLGVQTAGGRGVNVVMNITTPDVQGFQRSQSQVAAQVTRALSRGQRNR